jgi:hypothetical protein
MTSVTPTSSKAVPCSDAKGAVVVAIMAVVGAVMYTPGFGPKATALEAAWLADGKRRRFLPD